ncbi:metallophosphoesterase family protein [Sphingomonas sp.]|uniref:metallophosphoesterase family protein n=1 Tax=Sphingomonas sp. TaxID=28214 RepID=UPI003B00F39E
MLAKFLKARRSPVAAPAIPPGQRIYAIGDVHGCLEQLDTLLAMIAADDRARGDADTTTIFLGDLVDRGPASAQVVDRVRGLMANGRTRCLLGNHEEIFLQALDGEASAMKLFCRIGGRETALSYGLSEREYERLDYRELHAALDQRVPAADRSFLGACEDMIAVGDYLFVHAGVRPGVPLDQQRPSDLRWIRDAFLDHGRVLEKMIVHGHTIADTVETLPHRIGIDTGAFATGRLTALGLEGQSRWELHTGA